MLKCSCAHYYYYCYCKKIQKLIFIINFIQIFVCDVLAGTTAVSQNTESAHIAYTLYLNTNTKYQTDRVNNVTAVTIKMGQRNNIFLNKLIVQMHKNIFFCHTCLADQYQSLHQQENQPIRTETQQMYTKRQAEAGCGRWQHC